MKELSIEQKARRYDEAIRIAEEINNEQLAQPFDVMIRVFPELAESEDEKIRKRLVSYFKSQVEAYKDGNPEVLCTYNKWISWLEKQDQKPAEWSEEDDEMYKKVETAIDSYYAPFSRDAEEMSEWLKSLKDRVMLQPQKEWSEEDENMLKFILTDYRTRGAKEDSDIITWLKSLRPQNRWKPSKEYKEAVQLIYDEKLIPFKDGNQWCFLLGYNIQEGVCGFGDSILEAAFEFYKEYTTTRKCIGELSRPQSYFSLWKPSDEQMEALENAIRYGEEESIGILSLLYNDLKKLREE